MRTVKRGNFSKLTSSHARREKIEVKLLRNAETSTEHVVNSTVLLHPSTISPKSSRRNGGQQFELIASTDPVAIFQRSDPDTPAIQVVTELPEQPQNDGTYCFGSIPRLQLIQNNHGLHKYPAKFIPQIPRWALQFGPHREREVVLDPFCGSGTTLVEGGLLVYRF